MNQQLRILSNPNTSTKTLESLFLERQWLNGSPYEIIDAEVTIYNGVEIVASGILGDSKLFLDGADNNALRYDWATDEMATLTVSPKANYRALWVLNTGGRRVERYFNIHFWKLTNPIDDQDIIAERPEFEQVRPERRGKVTALSTGNLLYSDEFVEPSGFFDGSIINIQDGDISRRGFRVSQWNAVDKSFTLAEDLPYDISKGAVFSLYRSFRPEIESAWADILSNIQAWKPSLTQEYTGNYSCVAFGVFLNSAPQGQGLTWAVDSLDFRQLHLYQSVVKICQTVRVKKGDSFDLCRSDYEVQATKALNDLQVKVDSNMDGLFDTNDSMIGGTLWATH